MKDNKVRKHILTNSKGMTLLEIMIVLAILGGLIGVLATQVMGRFKKAKVEQAKLQISKLKENLDMFYTDCGFYPDSLEDLVQAPDSCSNWGPDPYVKKLAKDPWGNDYEYTVDGGNPVLISFGADREEGGDGENKDISSEDI